jgi:hypothetical protein
MFIVTCDHPYYPSVSYCQTIDEAKAEYQEAIDDIEAKDGQHVCKIAIAEVVQLLETRSYY